MHQNRRFNEIQRLKSRQVSSHVIGSMIAVLVLGSLSFPAAGAILGPRWEPEAAGAFWGAGALRTPSESSANPGNQVFKLSKRDFQLEFRPDLRLSAIGTEARKLSIVVRPRLVGSFSRLDQDTTASSNTYVEWNDAYVTFDASEKVTLTYGLQNYQWGPAESASPSNRVIRDTVQIKDVLYLVKGRHLFRLNFSPQPGLTAVGLVELSDNGDLDPVAEQAYAKKALLKSEWAAPGGADYAGVVVGAREREGAWLGEYFNWEFAEGFSLYADLAHQQGSSAWYPVALSSGATFVQSRKDERRLSTFSVLGVRYAFVGGSDLRGEWLFQEAGYSSSEVALAREAVSAAFLRADPSRIPSYAPIYAKNLARLQRAGLDLPGRQYLFFSWRWPEPFGVRDLQVYARDMISVQDGSFSSYVSSEKGVGDAGTLFGALIVNGGSNDSELRTYVDSVIVAGYRHNW